MSLRIIKSGLLDTVQDGGRPGYEHLGINRGGARDPFSFRLGNALLGNAPGTAALELHFPAAQIFFEAATIVALSGADFTPLVDDEPVPLHHPIAVAAGSVLRFAAHRWGACCYLSLAQNLQLTPWMGSYSTHLKAGAGGYEGRALQKGDRLHWYRFRPLPQCKRTTVLHWTAPQTVLPQNEIDCLIGPEWWQLTEESKHDWQEHWFQITAQADRMGYALAGPPLCRSIHEELLSSGVTFGTVQLLPGGQLMVLMADHQTTGGYPRIAQVAGAHLSVLAQKQPNDVLRFRLTDLATAEAAAKAQQAYLEDLQLACTYRMEEWCASVT